MLVQRVLDAIYPPRCLSCDEPLDSAGAFCGRCWRETPFVTGPCCHDCGAPIPGESEDASDLCDDCISTERPWEEGRAALLYEGPARRLVLSMKHAIRLDLARPAANWVAGAARPLLRPDSIVVPVPAHRLRLLRRTFNPAALLGGEAARCLGVDFCPDALVRVRHTRPQEGLSADERRKNVAGSIRPHPKRQRLAGRHVILIDDVMTSGATFSTATEACLEAGARVVSVVALARVVKHS